MEAFNRLCISLSAAVIIGFLLGGMKVKFVKKSYSLEQIESTKKLINNMANFLKYVTMCILTIGFIWCFYFLVLGIASPDQAEYADNMSELIVSVLTVISIIFAFVEFLRRAGD